MGGFIFFFCCAKDERGVEKGGERGRGKEVFGMGTYSMLESSYCLEDGKKLSSSTKFLQDVIMCIEGKVTDDGLKKIEER